MSRLRVLDIAKELKLDTKTVITKLNDLGVQVKNHFNAISDLEADKLRVYVRSGRNPDKEAAAKPTSKVVIRRRTDASSSEAASADASSAAHEVAAVAAPEFEQEQAPAPAQTYVETSPAPAAVSAAASEPEAPAKYETQKEAAQEIAVEAVKTPLAESAQPKLADAP
ncbi:MAG: hypothetical protein RI932_1795, partial [Pseudomonadota bacterium]